MNTKPVLRHWELNLDFGGRVRHGEICSPTIYKRINLLMSGIDFRPNPLNFVRYYGR